MFKRRKNNLKMNKNPRYLITEMNPKSPISEQYRTLRTNLQFSSIDDELKSILITSPDPAAGKSMTAANLAVVFAQQGKKTLIVDADLRRPTVHYTFRLNNLRGLSNLLIGESSIEKVAQATGIANLDALASGPVPPNPSELLASNRMKSLLSALEEAYDIIIIDTPPALAVADAKILANIVCGTLMVVRSRVSEIESTERAIEHFKDSNARLLGAVLNDREKAETNYYYYYGS